MILYKFSRSVSCRLWPLVLSVIVVPLIAAACGAQPQPEVTTELRRGTVERGSIDVTVSARGTVLPEEQVNLTFEQTGVVREVLVEVGDIVEPGDVLATLDMGRLSVALRQAKLALEIQQLNYDRLFAPPSDAELAAAYAGIEAARANYDQIAAGADPEEIWIAELQHERAYKQFEQADTALKAMQAWLPDDQVVSFREQREQALVGVEMARLQLSLIQSGAGEAALDAARASIAQAQAELNQLVEEPSELEAARLQTQVDQAELAVRMARTQLDNARLIAPMGGVVAQVTIDEGSSVPGQEPAIIIVDASHFHINLNIDELDIAAVTPGQPVVVTLDAAPDQTLQGQVVSISPAVTLDEGIASYEARVNLEPEDVPLLAGMTANASIITQRLQDVLLVPNWAIRVDAATGETVASVLRDDGTLQDVPVALGVRGETYSQVVAGLEEGQTVAVSLSRQELDFTEMRGTGE